MRTSIVGSTISMEDSDTSCFPDMAARPFLRLAGGKQKMVHFLRTFMPHAALYRRYYEPFFGGGSLFFSVQPSSAVISDVNEELMNCYRQVAKWPETVAQIAKYYASRDSADFYYSVRGMPTRRMSSAEKAGRFIYLNKAAFNGIYRVNRMGQFNVPYGPSANGPAIPSTETLVASGRLLAKSKILCGDFEDTVQDAVPGDFVYLDPPYPPRSATAYFTHYAAGRFEWEEQMRVARVFRELSDRGCLVMLSNADQRRVKALYSDFRIHRLNATRWLGSNGDRFRVREVVVTNYDLSAVGCR